MPNEAAAAIGRMASGTQRPCVSRAHFLRHKVDTPNETKRGENMSMINENGETVEQAKVEAARAPSVIVVDKCGKSDTFFEQFRALLGMASKDETRRVLNRVCVEACRLTVKMIDGENEKGGLVDVEVDGTRFVATDGRRLATLEVDRVYTPGLYEIKQSTAKAVTLIEDKNAGVYPNYMQVVPACVGMFKVKMCGPSGVFYACSRLGVILNPDYVFCLPACEYDVYVGDTLSPIVCKAGRFSMVLMPLRVDGYETKGRRGFTELDREVTRRVVADLAEREAVEEKIQARAAAAA